MLGTGTKLIEPRTLPYLADSPSHIGHEVFQSAGVSESIPEGIRLLFRALEEEMFGRKLAIGTGSFVGSEGLSFVSNNSALRLEIWGLVPRCLVVDGTLAGGRSRM